MPGGVTYYCRHCHAAFKALSRLEEHVEIEYVKALRAIKMAKKKKPVKKLAKKRGIAPQIDWKGVWRPHRQWARAHGLCSLAAEERNIQKLVEDQLKGMKGDER